MRMSSQDFFTLCVSLSSTLLGRVLPLGWLWHTAMTVAFFAQMVGKRWQRSEQASPAGKAFGANPDFIAGAWMAVGDVQDLVEDLRMFADGSPMPDDDEGPRCVHWVVRYFRLLQVVSLNRALVLGSKVAVLA